MRYFGSNAGLFAAVSTTNPQAPDLRSVPASNRGELLVRHFVERWEDSPSGDALVFLLRTAVTNDTVTDQPQATFNDLITQPVHASAMTAPISGVRSYERDYSA